MTDTNELLEAARAVLPYLEASTDKRDEMRASFAKEQTAEELRAESAVLREEAYLPEPERLRRRAAEIESKDAAIIRLREAVAKYNENAA